MKRTSLLLAFVLTIGALPAHSQYAVRLAWTASASASANPSLTYNVYRAATCAGQFSRINATPVAGPLYLDTSVASGAAYCYQVTSVLAGLESTPSNQALAAVPPPSDRQSACQHRGALIGWIRCLGSRPKRTTPGSEAP
jgi:hypothetical protein